ncbi:arylsulfatase [Alteromonas sp. 14N.309.X.WAT.G.H12]|uniref:arylsulfatase B n=1 Tax=Alteromonas sp. 14N.309.X.WAT.G.H12 TaxID=3120824 RepID=UPI002FD56EF9
MKKALWFNLVLAALLCAGCAQESKDTEGMVDTHHPERPNVLFIMVDDLGYGDVGYQGSEIKTPNIDALAAQGTVLKHGYAYPICSPTRAALMTGKNPLEFGIDGPMENDAMLPLDQTTLAEKFQQGGYQTWMVGKWHLGMGQKAAMPHNRGFDDFYGFLGGFVDYYTHVYFGGLDWQHNGTSIREKGHATELLTNRAVETLKNYNGNKPFFMYLSYNAPHTPLQYVPHPTVDYSAIDNPDRRVFAQLTTDVDAKIGDVLATLKETGLDKNTLVVFMSDNGGNLEGGANNGDFIGGKGRAFEGGIRVPIVVYWPDNIASGSMGTPMFPQDWMPTLLDAAGIPYSVDEFEGVSLLSALKTKESKPISRAVVIGTAKSKSVIEWPWKLINEDGKRYLFNLAEDATEQHNLISENPAIVESMAHLLASEKSTLPSKGAKGPPPESLFRKADGSFDYDVRKPETREPWAESAQ